MIPPSILNRTLTRADVEKHHALGITEEMLQRAQVTRRNDADARTLLGLNGRPGDFAGIEFPYLDPRSGRAVTCRLRVDHPPQKPDGSPDRKYLAPPAAHALRHLYFAPGAGDVLAATHVPVVIVESEKAALAVASAAERNGRTLLLIALGGCWNFRGVIGKTTDARGARVDEKGALPDFQLVTWAPKRRAVILFDARPNSSVQAARRELARVLRRLGADVQHGHLPDDESRINGPDDLIGHHGDEALWRVLDSARPDDFVRTDKGQPIAHAFDNIRLALSQLDVRPAYDGFRRVVCLNGEPVTDAQIERLWVRLGDAFGFRPSVETLRRLIVADAHEGTHHPVRDYLAGLRWDGTPRLDTWLVRYGGAPDTAYVRAVGALPLLAAVRRVRTPGAKFDELLVLESAQGTLKSSALRALCPHDEWFTDDLPLGVDSKETIERTAGRWIVEAAELHGHSGREAEQLKQFLSRSVDGPVRLAYERFAVSVPRQFVLIGTTNARVAYLRDSTGARRFWPVAVRRFDVDALLYDRDQIWAEAAAREAAGASIRLDPALWSSAADEQEQRRDADPWEETLEPLFLGDAVTCPTRIPTNKVWQALNLEARQQDNRYAARIARIAQRFGFVKRRARVDGQNVQCWLRLDTDGLEAESEADS